MAENEFEAFRRVQYVRVKDPLCRLNHPTRVYPVLQWHVDTSDNLLAVVVATDLPGERVTLGVDQVHQFLSGNQQILRVRKGNIMDAANETKIVEFETGKQRTKDPNLNQFGKPYIDLTFSEIWAFKNCRQRWAYTYKDRLTTKIDTPPLFLGKYYHSSLEWFYYSKFFEGHQPTEQELADKFIDLTNKRVERLRANYPNLDQYTDQLEFNQNLGEAMVRNWIKARTRDSFTMTEINGRIPIEVSFTVPIITPAGTPSSLYRFRGKIDGIVDYLGHKWLLEIKTSKYWSESDIDLLPIDPQCLGYMYGATKTFPDLKLAGAIYSVTKKSSLRLGKAEDQKEFRKRVIQDYSEKTDKYYINTPIYTQPEAIEDFATQLYDITKDMHNPKVYKSVGKSTCGFGCQFRQLCTATSCDHREAIKDQFYRTKEVKHEELDGEEED